MTTNGSEKVVVRSTINYFKNPCNEYWPEEGDARPKDVDAREVEITDMSSLPERPTIHTHGFEVVPCKLDVFDNILESPPSTEVLYKAVAEHLKETVGATRVVPYQFTMRNATAAEIDKMWESKEKTADKDPSELPGAAVEKPGENFNGKTAKTSGPIAHVHIDNHWEDIDRINMIQATHLGGIPAEEATRLLTSCRHSTINVWKPLLKPVTRDPLCVCDVRSVATSDVVRLTAKTARGDHQTSGLHYSPDHKWYFYDGISTDQALLLHIHDTAWQKVRPGKAPGVPHTGFVDPRYVDGPPRSSMEIRCMVFWEDQPKEG